MNHNVVKQKDDRGFQADLARKMGMSRQAISIYLSGNRIPGPQMAKKLEQATGISRLAWMYPEEHDNPMLRAEKNSEPD